MAVSRYSGQRGPAADAWFERRADGRGIRPANWKGWALIVLYLGLIGAAVVAMPRPEAADPISFGGPLAGLLAVMAAVTIGFVLLVRRFTAAAK